MTLGCVAGAGGIGFHLERSKSQQPSANRKWKTPGIENHRMRAALSNDRRVVGAFHLLAIGHWPLAFEPSD